MSSRSNRSKQLRQMEDAVLGAGGGLGGGLGGAGGLGAGSSVSVKKGNAALADLEREVKLSIGADDAEVGTGTGGGDSGSARSFGGGRGGSSGSSRRKKGSSDLQASFAAGLAATASKDGSSVGSARFADKTLTSEHDPLDARDLDEDFGSGRSGGYASGMVRERCGACVSWLGSKKKLIGIVTVLAAVAVAIAVGAKGSSSGGGGEAAASTVKSAPPLELPAEEQLSKQQESEPAEPEGATAEEAQEGEAFEEEEGPSFPPGASRLEMMKARILFEDISYAEDLEAPANVDEDPTPQYQAIEWLANQDEMAIDPLDLHLSYRYALAVFWFATYENARLYDEENPPSKDDEEFANWDVRDDWMSGKGICLWYGVRCWPNKEHEDRFDGNHQVIHLNLTLNNIRGPVPDELFTVLTDMLTLDLSDNLLTGFLSDEIGNMVRLETLRMGMNQMSGDIPPSVGELIHLKGLFLEHAGLEGPLPVELGQLKELRHLSLHNNWLNGTIPYELQALTNLQTLYLDINSFEGEIPEYLFDLPALHDLRLSQNLLSGPIPDIPASGGGSQALRILFLDHNQLTADIPDSLEELVHLEDLHLYKNELTGPLPPSIGNLRGLNRLFLDQNLLTGIVPPEWAELDDLEELYLYENDLTGMLPGDVLAGMVDLRHLKVGGNSFYGPIPEELGAMYKLEQVGLEDNVFQGTLPDLGDLHKLESLLINSNEITGVVSAATCDLIEYYELEKFSADCAEGPGGVPAKIVCECCTSCPVLEAEVSV